MMQAFRVLIIINFAITLVAGGSPECPASQAQSLIPTTTSGSESPIFFTRRPVGSMYTGWISSISAIVPIDFDKDGDPDLVCTNYYDGTIAWFENDGTLSFSYHLIAKYYGHPEDIGVADLDSDGDWDIASTDAGIYPEDPGFVIWWENDGSQNFSRHDIDTERTGAKTVRTTDLDDDGDKDIVIGCRKNDNLFWYENDGIGNFVKHILYPTACGCWDLEVLDFDFDGDLDVLAASPGFFNPWISWFENDGDQVFTEHVIDATYENAADVCSSDLDDDGDLDVICAAANFGNDKGDRIAWWENDGNQQFEKHILVENYKCGNLVDSADLDRDQAMDIISQGCPDNNTNRYALVWWRNKGDSVFDQFITETETFAYEFTIFDIDLDGDIDILTGDALGKIAWWENQPNVAVQPSMPSHFYHPGDTFSLQAILDNPSSDQTLEQMPLFVLLYYGGEFFFHPEWSQEVGYTLVDIAPGVSAVSLIDPFPWPDGAGEASGVYFFATLATQDLTQIFGVYGYWEFGWSETGS